MVLPSIYKRDASVDRTKTFKTDQIQLLRSSGIEPKNTTEAHRASSLPARNAAHAAAAGVNGGSARVVRARKPKMQSARQKGRFIDSFLQQLLSWLAPQAARCPACYGLKMPCHITHLP